MADAITEWIGDLSEKVSYEVRDIALILHCGDVRLRVPTEASSEIAQAEELYALLRDYTTELENVAGQANLACVRAPSAVSKAGIS